VQKGVAAIQGIQFALEPWEVETRAFISALTAVVGDKKKTQRTAGMGGINIRPASGGEALTAEHQVGGVKKERICSGESKQPRRPRSLVSTREKKNFR